MRTLGLIAALFLPAVLVAAPVPKEKEKGPLFFPVVEGTKREVEDRLGSGDPRVVTETVTKVEEKDGVYRVTVERETDGKKSGAPQVYAVSGKGVSRLTSFGKETKNPLVMLNLGVKAGETWKDEYETTVGNGAKTLTSSITNTMGKEEEVEVPAGKYKAVRVESESTRDGKTTKSTIWFSAEVGIVKLETFLGDVKSTQQLKAFTIGKGEKKDEPKKGK